MSWRSRLGPLLGVDSATLAALVMPTPALACGTIVNFTAAYLAADAARSLDAEDKIKCKFSAAAARLRVSNGTMSNKDAPELLAAMVADANASPDKRLRCLGGVVEAHFKRELKRHKPKRTVPMAEVVENYGRNLDLVCAGDWLVDGKPRLVYERREAEGLRGCLEAGK